jgi:hypothetical protein
VITWDGGGADNNWSTPANWLGDVVPSSEADVVFDATSNKDSTIDPLFNPSETVASIFINNYSGTINQNTNLIITKDYSQTTGKFVSPVNFSFSVGKSFSIPDTSNAFSRFNGTGIGADPYLIYDVYGLQSIKGWLNDVFQLNNNINAFSTVNWNSGRGFDPIDVFSGVLDGNNQAINNLVINRPTEDYVGLFSRISSAKIDNLGLININIVGKDYVGGLVGRSDGGFGANSSITNSYSSGNVSGANYVGGLVGRSVGGFLGNSVITDSYSTAGVIGNRYIGGFVGASSNVPFFGASIITRSYSAGNINGSNDVGGFVGDSGSNSYSDDFWDYETAGLSENQDTGNDGDVAGITGESTTNMQQDTIYRNAGWDFDIIPIWKIAPNEYPKLNWQP